MKKIASLAAMAISVAAMVSCGQARPPKANLQSDIDTLSYVIGVELGNEIKTSGMLENQLHVDSAYLADFLRGVNEAARVGEDKGKAAYLAGLQIGAQLGQQILANMESQYFGNDSTKGFSRDNVLAAFNSVVAGSTPLLSVDTCTVLYQVFMQEMQKRAMEQRQAEMERQQEEYMKQLDQENAEKWADYRAENEKFLADNKQKEGVQTTASGLQYKVLTQGTGQVPTADQMVKVEYEGRLIDGTVFDASSKHGSEPAVFSPNRVIKGWKEALTMMPVGSEWELYVPQNLAYGPQDNGDIKPYSTLIFKVKLVDIAE